MLAKTDKIILPIDNIVSDSLESGLSRVTNKIGENEMGLDIGPATVELFKEYINRSKTIVWNGPVGVFENPLYQNGTKKICEMFNPNEQTIIIGGGDSASAVNNLGYKDKVTHISTGGGASLELLEGKDLPGISIIGE